MYNVLLLYIIINNTEIHQTLKINFYDSYDFRSLRLFSYDFYEAANRRFGTASSVRALKESIAEDFLTRLPQALILA